VLGYLPFEILLQELPQNNTHFSDHAYLLKDYQISYSYSASLLQEMIEKQHAEKPKKNFLAFAPSFGEASAPVASRSLAAIRSGLNPLKFNIPEADQLNQIMGGDVFSALSATEPKFIEVAPFYRIIHLATHGKANDQAGDYSFLAFTEIADSLENEFLYTRDLYNLRLNADMVVLSACETGVGELQRGEGIVSLARGFSYAGAKSIVTTLWSINDATTVELMEGFYAYLKDGMAKDAALRRAKLDYIQSHPNDEVHPFYWAAFVAVGDMSPVPVKGKYWWFWGFAVLGLIAFAGYWVFRNRGK